MMKRFAVRVLLLPKKFPNLPTTVLFYRLFSFYSASKKTSVKNFKSKVEKVPFEIYVFLPVFSFTQVDGYLTDKEELNIIV